MKRKWKKRIFTFLTAAMAGLLMSAGLVQLSSDLHGALSVYADSPNVVSLQQTTAEVNDSNLVYVDLIVKGNPSAPVTVTYRSSSGTAIEGVDYVGVYNSVDFKLNAVGEATYRIAIKSLNDSSTRQKLRVYSGQGDFGRYFNLEIVSAENASIDPEKKNCKCYLGYAYRVEGTTGLRDNVLGRDIAYINDYRDMLSRYHKGDNDIDGKETWKTWKEGVSFNDDTTRRWTNAYINQGYASAYCSYVLSSIDDDKVHSNSNIYMLSGNKEFMDKYERSKNCPGLSLYYEIEPCTSGGYQIDGRAMKYIGDFNGPVNPWKRVDELVDLEELNYISPNRKIIHWI